MIIAVTGQNDGVPYFSAVFAHTDEGWIGTEADLSELAGLDDIADLMREAVVESAGDLAVLLIEEEDEWFAVVRLDDEDDPRVFLSDPRASFTNDVAAMLYEQAGGGDAPTEDPAGDAELLSDLGTDGKQLTELGERTLPGDALFIVAEQAGFSDEYDRLR